MKTPSYNEPKKLTIVWKLGHFRLWGPTEQSKDHRAQLRNPLGNEFRGIVSSFNLILKHKRSHQRMKGSLLADPIMYHPVLFVYSRE